MIDDLITALVSQPWLALIPAACFGAVSRRWRLKLSAVAATTWLLYAIYEFGMKRRWLCSGECNIRIDLLVIYPVILLISLGAAVGAAVALLRRRRSLNAP